MNVSSIRIRLKDVNNRDEFPYDLTIQCSAVPRVGEVINLFDILPEENRGEEGWWYDVEQVEWAPIDESKKWFEPIVTVRKKKL